MKIEAYLVINRSGSLRVVKSRPYLNNQEMAIRLALNVPVEFFERIMPTVQIDIPKDAVVTPEFDQTIRITALEVAKNLNVEVSDVEDALTQLVKDKEREE